MSYQPKCLRRVTIWGRPSAGVERIDECSARDAGRLLSEYALAFGAGWVLWAGLKRDEPR